MLAHLDNTPPVRLGGCQMQSRELGDGMTDFIIDCPLRNLAACDVYDRNSHHSGGRGHCKHLVAVAEDYDGIGMNRLESIGYFIHAFSHCTDTVGRTVAIDTHRHSGRYLESGSCDLVDRHAVLRHKMHIRRHYTHVNAVGQVQSLSQRHQEPPVGAGARHYRNSSHVILSLPREPCR